MNATLRFHDVSKNKQRQRSPERREGSESHNMERHSTAMMTSSQHSNISTVAQELQGIVRQELRKIMEVLSHTILSLYTSSLLCSHILFFVIYWNRWAFPPPVFVYSDILSYMWQHLMNLPELKTVWKLLTVDHGCRSLYILLVQIEFCINVLRE